MRLVVLTLSTLLGFTSCADCLGEITVVNVVVDALLSGSGVSGGLLSHPEVSFNAGSGRASLLLSGGRLILECAACSSEVLRVLVVVTLVTFTTLTVFLVLSESVVEFCIAGVECSCCLELELSS